MALASHWLLALALVLGYNLSLAFAHPNPCLINAVSGDSDRAQFHDEPNFMAQDVRPYNGNYEYHPKAVMYPKTSQEVSDIVNCAVAGRAKVQARSGGHDYINKCIGGADGAIIIDLKFFSQFSMDNATNIATIGPGLTVKNLVYLLNDNGARMLPLGSYATVGLGGHATVGGIGALARSHGLTLDFMVDAEVILANGTIITASETEYPDIFWAIRGAAQSFGIVTKFRFQTLPQPPQIQTYRYTLMSDNAQELADAYKAYHEVIRNEAVSKSFSTAAAVCKGAFYITGHFFGSQQDFKDEIDALKLRERLPFTPNNTVRTNTWVDINEDEFAHKSHTLDLNATDVFFYAKDQAIPPNMLPSNDSIDALFNYIATEQSDYLVMLSPLAGGASNDVAVDATAYPHRDLAYFVALYAITPAKATDYTYSFVDKAAGLASGDKSLTKFGAYAGSPDARFENPQERYWGSNLERLQKIKAFVDPRDVFSTPQGVKRPAGF